MRLDVLDNVSYFVLFIELKNQKSSLEDAAARAKREIVKLRNPSVRFHTVQSSIEDYINLQ